MEFNLLQDIREIFHGLGERKPRLDTVQAIQSVLLKQMALLIFQTQQVAKQNTKKKIVIKDVLYVLRNNKQTLIRILTYYLLKDNMRKVTSISHTSETDQINNTVKNKKSNLKNKQSTDDFVDTIFNIELDESIYGKYDKVINAHLTKL